jgi:hypothetical protein
VANINVVKDYDWCVSPRGSGLRNKAPRIHVKSFKVKSNESFNRLRSYLNLALKSDTESFYNNLYGNTEEEDIFNFPFFSDSIRNFSNTYGDTYQSAFLGTLDSAMGGIANLGGAGVAGASGIGNGITAGQNAFSAATDSGASLKDATMRGLGAFVGSASNGDPGSYIEAPLMYQYENNDAPLEVSFVLSNTVNSDHMKNYELVKKLTTINRPKRLNSVAMEPPRLYQVKVPGHRYMRWAYCSSFNVNFIGTKREHEGKILPEGYQITMSFTSLTTEVSNFMDKV